MNNPMATSSKRFVSLKWSALMLSSALLVIVFAVFLFSSRYSAQIYLKELSAERSKRYAEQIDALQNRLSERIQSLGNILVQVDGVRNAIKNGNKAQVEYQISPFWKELNRDTSVSSAVVFSPVDDVVMWLGDPSIPSELMEKFREDWKVRWSLSCFNVCEMYVAVPLEIDGWGRGMVVIGAHFNQVINRFESISKADVALAIQRTQGQSDDARYLQGWNTEVVYLSNPDAHLPLLKSLSETYDRTRVAEGMVVKMQGRYFEVELKPINGAVFPRQGELLFITDVTAEMVQHHILQRNSLIFSVFGLVFAELMLLFILWGPLNRLRAMASVLPMLATQQFSSVRRMLNGLQRDTLFLDESDVMNNAAMRLSHLLENLQDQLQERANELEKRTFDLQAEQLFVQSILDTAHAMILTQDSNGLISMVNRHCSVLTGFDEKELIGQRFVPWASITDDVSSLSAQLTELNTGLRSELSHESPITCKDGQMLYMSWHHSLLSATKDQHKVLSIALDISERKAAEDRLVWLASHDPLTGLFNRRRFGEELQKSIAHAKRYNRAGAILFFDLDQFKDVNDTSGHKVGDELLRRISECLRVEARDTDLIFRLGGDEFAMLVREVGIDDVAVVATRLCAALKNVEVIGRERIHRASSSVGIALFPEHGDQVEDLVANADIAMYQAKREGRSGWHVYSPAELDREKTHERVYWNELVKAALSQDLLKIAFQPILELGSEQLSHFEALLRVEDEQGNLLPTFKFIQSAESSGLIQQIDLVVLDKVLKYKKKLENLNVNVVFAVNLSGVSFRNPNLCDDIARKLVEHQVNAQEIIFEITETSAVDDSMATAAKMREIKKLGCKFALDDFGVGFTSLYHIKQLPIDIIKIDGSFIRHINEQSEDQALVRAIVSVAKVFGLKTVAEFVEDEKILKILRVLGVDYAQGYHISKPEYFDTLWGKLQQ